MDRSNYQISRLQRTVNLIYYFVTLPLLSVLSELIIPERKNQDEVSVSHGGGGNSRKQGDIIKKLESELVKIKYLNSQLILSQRKREEMIAFILDENRKLRFEIDELNKDILKKDQVVKVVEQKREIEILEKEHYKERLRLATATMLDRNHGRRMSVVYNQKDLQFLSTNLLQQPPPAITQEVNATTRKGSFQSNQEIATGAVGGSGRKASFSKTGEANHNGRRQSISNKGHLGSQQTFSDHFTSNLQPPTMSKGASQIDSIKGQFSSPNKKKKTARTPRNNQNALPNDDNWLRQPPGMRLGYGLDKKDSNELSLYNDYLGKNSILKFTHEQIEEVLQSEKIKHLKKMFESADAFREEMNTCSDFKIEDYLLSFKAMLNDVQRLSHLLIRLKVLLLNSYLISKNLSLSEALEKIVDATCETLECDRASVFMVDELTGELWTKVAKGSEMTIRIPLNSGIVGGVVHNNLTENIEDAYKDNRFNKEIDKKNNYRTKAMICVPVRDQYGNVIGACQAINKVQEPKFTSDDEYIFETLALNAGIILRNSMQYDQSIVFQHKLRNLINIGIKMNSKVEIVEMLIMTEKLLADAFGVDRAYIYIVDKDKKEVTRYTEEGEIKVFPIDAGLIGLAIQKRDALSIPDAYHHQSFNGMIDIDTSMPVIVKPIMSVPQLSQQEKLIRANTVIAHDMSKENKISFQESTGEVLACIEVINKLGVVGRSTRNKANLDPLDIEMLDLFERQLRGALTTLKFMNGLKKE